LANFDSIYFLTAKPSSTAYLDYNTIIGVHDLRIRNLMSNYITASFIQYLQSGSNTTEVYIDFIRFWMNSSGTQIKFKSKAYSKAKISGSTVTVTNPTQPSTLYVCGRKDEFSGLLALI